MSTPPDADLRVDASYEALMTQADKLRAVGAELTRLRDAAAAPDLAARMNDLAQSVHYLTYVVAASAAAQHRSPADLPSYAQKLELAKRGRELARLEAAAACGDDGSRDQTIEWKREAVMRLRAMPLARCFEDELARGPDRASKMTVKIHVGEGGRVQVAGLAEQCLPSCSFTADFAYCVLEHVDAVVFPPPEGKAIVTMPFEHEPGDQRK